MNKYFIIDCFHTTLLGMDLFDYKQTVVLKNTIFENRFFRLKTKKSKKTYQLPIYSELTEYLKHLRK